MHSVLFGDAMEMTRAVEEAEQRLQGIVSKTPLQPSNRLSERYEANILIKREDMQAVRSFKIRGAYNKIASLPPEDRTRPIVCASAGNHAQGVAFACAHLGIGGTIFMPRITPTQKIERVSTSAASWSKSDWWAIPTTNRARRLTHTARRSRASSCTPSTICRRSPAR